MPQAEVSMGGGQAHVAAHTGRLVVGVIGGMGPLATAETFRRIVAATPAVRDQDHLHVIVDSDPLIPDRTTALLRGGADPRPRLFASAQRLQAAGAQVLCMPCNTAHAYHRELQTLLRIPLVDMVLETALAARAARVTHGLLATQGTVEAGVFHDRFLTVGVPLVIPSAHTQRGVSDAIGHVKAGGSLSVAADMCRPALADLVARGAGQVVLGCTELSLLTSCLAAAAPVIDSLQVMVETVVQAALRLK